MRRSKLLMEGLEVRTLLAADIVGGVLPEVIDFSAPAPGDANLDGIFNSADLVQIMQAGEYEDGIPYNSTWADGDFNGDYDFTTADFVLVMQETPYITETPKPGDVNCDGVFNSADFVQIMRAGEYEDGIPYNSTWADGDFDGDRDFTSHDLVLLMQEGIYEDALPQSGDAHRDEIFDLAHWNSTLGTGEFEVHEGEYAV